MLERQLKIGLLDEKILLYFFNLLFPFFAVLFLFIHPEDSFIFLVPSPIIFFVSYFLYSDSHSAEERRGRSKAVKCLAIQENGAFFTCAIHIGYLSNNIFEKYCANCKLTPEDVAIELIARGLHD